MQTRYKWGTGLHDTYQEHAKAGGLVVVSVSLAEFFLPRDRGALRDHESLPVWLCLADRRDPEPRSSCGGGLLGPAQKPVHMEVGLAALSQLCDGDVDRCGSFSPLRSRGRPAWWT